MKKINASEPFENLQSSSPLEGKLDYANLMLSFFKALFSREKELPVSVLYDYLEGFDKKREVFLNSARDFHTPQYFYDCQNMIFQIEKFKDSFSRNLPRFQIFYAIKSNCFSGIVNDIAKAGLGLDASSGHELSMALKTDCRKILFTGPGKTDEELDLALNNSGRVTLLIDSFGELGRLSRLSRRMTGIGPPLVVGVRVQGPKKSRWDKFGIPLNDLSSILETIVRLNGIIPGGIQFHSSWNMDPARQISMIKDLGKYLKNMPGHLHGYLKFIDIGGGFWPEQGEFLQPQNTLVGRLALLLGANVKLKRTYYYHPSSRIDSFARGIANALLTQPDPLKHIEVFMEPGRWISNSSMHILLSVMEQKGSEVIITDGGINLLGWERPMTEFIPVINLSKKSLKERRIKIFGPLCTPDDVWGYSVFGGDISPGDVLLIPDQGAYTYSLSQSFIKPIARVIKYDGNKLEELQKERYLLKHDFLC